MRQARRSKTNRVLVFGTFDLLHPGHRWFLRQARTRGEKLHVIVARDKNVDKLKTRLPIQNERTRLKAVRAVASVTRAQLGAKDLRHRYRAIVKLKPDLICLGYDQRYLTATLQRDLARLHLPTKVVRLPAFRPEKYKSSLLKHSSSSLLLGRKILMLTAHPDDESYLAAGTIHANHRHGGRTTLVCATLGERGASHLSRPVSPARLKRIRLRELRSAARCLRIARLHVLYLPDGQVMAHRHTALREAAIIAKHECPQLIVSFGPDGVTGHHDHIAIGQVARQLAQRLKVPCLAFSLPPKLLPRAAHWLGKRRRAPHYTTAIKYRRPTVRIPIDRTVKLRALRWYKSQLDAKNPFTNFPAPAVTEILKAEYFISR